MPQASILSWRVGGGWLVLSGGGSLEETIDIDTSVLSRTVLHDPLAYLCTSADLEWGDRYLEHLADLGGRTGFLVNVESENGEEIADQLKDTGIIVLADTQQTDVLLGALRGAVLLAIERAYLNGATIYAQGRMAATLAAWMPAPQMRLSPGWGWIENAIIAAPYDEAFAKQLAEWLRTILPGAYGIGIGRGSALAFDPQGAIELWGGQAVQIVLAQAE